MGNSMIDIVVPVTAHIACPDRSFRHRPVSACLDCKAFGGFIQVAAESEQQKEVPFEVKYRIECCHPISRRMTLVERD